MRRSARHTTPLGSASRSPSFSTRGRLVVLAVVASILCSCAGAATPSPITTPRAALSPANVAETSAPTSATLTIYADASLGDVFLQIKSAYEQARPGQRLDLRLGDSATLRSQLTRGANGDVFVAPDTASMDAARTDGIVEGSPSVFAHHRLVAVVPTANPSIAALQDLARPGVKLAAELDSVAAGAEARQALTALDSDPEFGAGFASRVMANLVAQEKDVKAVLARIQSGDADAAVMYVSDTSTSTPGSLKVVGLPGPTPPFRGFQWHSNELGTVISDQFGVIGDYPVAIVRGGPNADEGRAFIAYLQGADAQGLLRKVGLVPLVS